VTDRKGVRFKDHSVWLEAISGRPALCTKAVVVVLKR
jgi:hypothetical protein